MWIRSGVIEQLDLRQVRLLKLVHEKICLYYNHLHGTRPSLKHPLSLSRLMRLCKRSGATVTNALRLLANTIPFGSEGEPPVIYDRVSAQRNPSHRPYRIFLRRGSD